MVQIVDVSADCSPIVTWKREASAVNTPIAQGTLHGERNGRLTNAVWSL